MSCRCRARARRSPRCASPACPTDRFVFEGFLPRTDGARAARLRELRSERRTLVFYESVHRLRRNVGGARSSTSASNARPCSRASSPKIHEQIRSGTLGELAALARRRCSAAAASSSLSSPAAPPTTRRTPSARRKSTRRSPPSSIRRRRCSHVDADGHLAQRAVQAASHETARDDTSSWESAGQSLRFTAWRKVRAPQGRVPGNAWGARAYGKCNRKQTAYSARNGAVRVKRCGKSAPRRWQHAAARQTPPGARPNRGAHDACPHALPGRSLEVRGDAHPRGMTALDRTRLTGRLPPFL